MFTEHNQIVSVIAPDADVWAADPASDVVNTKLYGHVTFLLHQGVGATGTVKLEVEECTAADGTGNTAIAYKYKVAANPDTWGDLTAVAAAGYTTVAGSNQMVAIEIDAAELSDGSPFVRVQCTEVVDSPCDGGMIAIMSKPRHSSATMPTAVS